jgi:hypothetical protein
VRELCPHRSFRVGAPAYVSRARANTDYKLGRLLEDLVAEGSADGLGQ